MNATGYGLTSGLKASTIASRSSGESHPAGNLYINRSTTGAIVLRQPFGGMGKIASVRASKRADRIMSFR